MFRIASHAAALPRRLRAALGRLGAFPRGLALAAATALTLTAAPGARADVTIFAAASMKNALEEIAADWRAETGETAILSLAGSSSLARQIQQGAPADLFISANIGWMDALQEAGLIDPATRFDLAGNALALIAWEGAGLAPLTIPPAPPIEEMLGAEGRLAMALVDAVPAGIYGKAALEELGLWDALAPRVAQADNVRAALALVATGAAPLGIVYATDAAAEPRATLLSLFPETAHPPIRYPAAAVSGGDAAAAARFLRHLRGDEARATLARHGFRPLAMIPPQEAATPGAHVPAAARGLD